MTIRPLTGRVIVTRVTQVTSTLLAIPDTYKDPRSPRTADRGVVLAAGEPPEGLPDAVQAGDEIFYHGPDQKLSVSWNGQECYAVHYDEVLGVVEDDEAMSVFEPDEAAP